MQDGQVRFLIPIPIPRLLVPESEPVQDGEVILIPIPIPGTEFILVPIPETEVTSLTWFRFPKPRLPHLPGSGSDPIFILILVGMSLSYDFYIRLYVKSKIKNVRFCVQSALKVVRVTYNF